MLTRSIFLIGTLLTSCAAADLQQQVVAMANAHHGKVALFAQDLATGNTLAINADTPVATASVIKLPIMIEAMYQVKAGKRSLAEKLTLAKDNQVPGSGVLQFMDPGLQLTLKDAVTLMMVLSDNTATNLVIDRLGIAAVNARLDAMGLKNTRLYKKVFKPPEGPVPPEQKQFGLGKTTAREMAQAAASIARCELHDPVLCETMVEIMRHQEYRNMIPRYLETLDITEKPSAIANKVGQLDEVRADVALVATRSGTIVISAFTWDNQDQSWTPENEAELLIARMARAIVQSWAGGVANTVQPQLLH